MIDSESGRRCSPRPRHITNLLESRRRLLPEPAAVQLTRRQDLLEFEML
jgi:hypothetical protein